MARLTAVAPLRKQAVVYLRVSTTRQMDTAIDIDADGNSIATQRDHCTRKAAAVDATVVREFLEPGNSAQTIEKRPVFRQLLAYVAEHPEIDYVIIYMRSRAFRNLGDAVLTKRQLEKHGIRLLSAKEDFGEGYLADAMEAVTDIFNEIEVRRNGEDIRQKMQHKALSGGTISRAKLGYLNVRVDIEGRLVNSIALDPERAPLVRHAFELYASGDYTLERLSETLADLGLRSRPSRSRPAKVVNVEGIRRMLRDPYYTGSVMYKGQLVEGRHAAIVDMRLWHRVQTVADFRSRPGQRDRVLSHFLKGMLFCGRCDRNGQVSRLIYTEARSRSGRMYGYFMCMGRQQGTCTLTHLPAHLVEEAIAEQYVTLKTGPDFIAQIEHELADVMSERQQLVHDIRARLAKQLRDLDQKEERLIDLAAEGTLSKAKIHQRINAVRLERQRVQEGLADTGSELALGAQRLLEAVRLVSHPESLYAEVSDKTKRQLNQTFFEHFYVDETEDGVVHTPRTVLRAPFDDIRGASSEYVRRSTTTPKRSGEKARALRYLLDRPSRQPVLVNGSSIDDVVDVKGLEPLTSRV